MAPRHRARVLLLVAALTTLGRGSVEAQRKATVTGITITNTGGAGPVVTWQAVQGAISYQVERVTTATATGNRSPQLAVTTWQDAPLAVSGTYVYRVTATLRKGMVTGEASFTWAPAGTTSGAVLTLSPNGCDFGTVSVGTTSSPCSLTLTNSGGPDGVLISTSSGNSSFPAWVNAFPFTATGCGQMATGTSCVITFRFAPTQTGAQGVVLQVRNAAGTVQIGAQIGGNGGAAAPTGPAVFTLSPNGCDFGTVSVGTTSSPCSLTLTNSGGPDGVLISTASGNSSIPSWVNAFPFTATGCGQMLSGTSCVITFRFAPTQTGSQGVILQVRNAAGTAQIVAQIGGTGG